MLTAIIVAMVVDATAPSAGVIQCNFPGQTSTQKSINVVLEPRPSLKDQPGLYRVIMDLNGSVSLRAAAQPIPSTKDRDILVRGISPKKSVYTIGLRDDGVAALNLKTARADNTRIGACRNFERHFERWLS